MMTHSRKLQRLIMPLLVVAMLLSMTGCNGALTEATDPRVAQVAQLLRGRPELASNLREYETLPADLGQALGFLSEIDFLVSGLERVREMAPGVWAFVNDVIGPLSVLALFGDGALDSLVNVLRTLANFQHTMNDFVGELEAAASAIERFQAAPSTEGLTTLGDALRPLTTIGENGSLVLPILRDIFAFFEEIADGLSQIDWAEADLGLAEEVARPVINFVQERLHELAGTLRSGVEPVIAQIERLLADIEVVTAVLAVVEADGATEEVVAPASQAFPWPLLLAGLVVVVGVAVGLVWRNRVRSARQRKANTDTWSGGWDY